MNRGPEIATDCDRCHAPIPYGVTCYQVPTGTLWDGDDADRGKPVVRIECARCYRGPAVGMAPLRAVKAEDLP